MNLDNRKYGVVDIDTGDIIVQAKYTSLGYFNNGLAVAYLGFDMGYIDSLDNARISFGKYKAGNDFVKGFASVLNWENKRGVINTIDEIIIPFEYDEIDIQAEFLPYVKCTKEGIVKWIDIRPLCKEIILDGLIYYKTYSVQKFKELMQIKTMYIRRNLKSGEVYFNCGICTGISSIHIDDRTNKDELMISLVMNVSGMIFWLLHNVNQLGVPYIQKEKYIQPQKTEETPPTHKTIPRYYTNDDYNNDYNDDWDDDYYRGWSRQEVESGLADAFEDDPDALWNID